MVKAENERTVKSTIKDLQINSLRLKFIRNYVTMKKYLLIIPILIGIIACDSEAIETNSQTSATDNPLIGVWEAIETKTSGFGGATIYNFSPNELTFEFLNDSVVDVQMNLINPNEPFNFKPSSAGLHDYHQRLLLPGFSFNQDSLRMINTRAWVTTNEQYDNSFFNYRIENGINDTILRFSRDWVILLTNDQLNTAVYDNHLTLKKR